MKTFLQHLVKEEASGDCFKSAYQYIKKNPTHTLVHAMVSGEGRRFPHAWTEDRLGNVHDFANGQDIVINKDAYYKQVSPDNMQRYNLDDYSYESPKYARGYVDPVANNKFYKARDLGFDGGELGKPSRDDIENWMKVYNEDKPPMLSFGQFINEANAALVARLIPAIKKDGVIVKGKRGQTHYDIWNDHFPGKGKLWQQDNVHAGFHDPKTNKFLAPYEAGVDSEDLSNYDRVNDIDSTDLMTPMQRFRKFGTEETINELKIAKLYTVAPRDLPKGEDLLSMSTQYGKVKGRKRFMTKWGTDEMAKTAIQPDYADDVHLSREPLFAHAIRPIMTQAAAKNMAIYDVRPSRKFKFDPRTKIDKSGNVVMVKDRIPAKYIRKRWNDTKGKWDNWNAPAMAPNIATNEELDYDISVLRSRVVPAIKMLRGKHKGKIFTGERGQWHLDVAMANKLPSIKPPRKSVYAGKAEFGYDRGFVDPMTKKYYTGAEMKLDAAEIGRLGKHDYQWKDKVYGKNRYDGIDEGVAIADLVPAIVHPDTGKVYTGKRGEGHADLLWRYLPDKTPARERWNAIKHSGYVDPVSNKFYKYMEINVDSSELRGNLYKHRYDEAAVGGFDRDVLISRIVPAIIHPDTGKVYTGPRGETHAQLLDRHLPDRVATKNKWHSAEHSGYVDPVTNKFYKWHDLDIDSTELRGNLGKSRYDEQQQTDFDMGVMRSRIVPAIKLHKTGVVYTGKRGEWHGDIAAANHVSGRARDPENDPNYGYLNFTRGFVDPVSSKFYNAYDIGIDAAEIGYPNKRRSDEAVDAQFLQRSPVVHNPSRIRLAGMRKAANNPEAEAGGRLRYVTDRGKNVWVAPASRMIHDQIAIEAGMDLTKDNWYKGTQMGFITKRDIPKIIKHPKGLLGWINDRHKPTAHDFAGEKSNIQYLG